LSCHSQTVDPLPDVVFSTRSSLTLFLLTNEGWNNYCKELFLDTSWN
jgi:hypothetical protein